MRKASFWYWNARSAIAWALVLITVLYFIFTNENFLNSSNLYALAQVFAPLALTSVGLAVVMISAQFDLSLAAVFPLAALIVVRLMDGPGPVVAMLVAVMVGLAVGLLNGTLIAKLGIPSLAVTVATMVLVVGIGFLVTGNEIVSSLNYEVSMGIGARVLGSLSPMVLIELLLVVFIWFLVAKTWFGRYLYAIGGDESRARSTNLPVNTTLILAFVICALCAAVAGGFQGMLLATGQAGQQDAILLQSATAALIGGVAIKGGRGRIGGVIGAAALLAVLNNGLSLAGTPAPAIQFVNGLVLIAIVVLDQPLERLLGRLQPRAPIGQSLDGLTPLP